MLSNPWTEKSIMYMCTSMFLLHVIFSAVQFNKNETYTTIEKDNLNNIDFPLLTICYEQGIQWENEYDSQALFHWGFDDGKFVGWEGEGGAKTKDFLKSLSILKNYSDLITEATWNVNNQLEEAFFKEIRITFVHGLCCDISCLNLENTNRLNH